MRKDENGSTNVTGTKWVVIVVVTLTTGCRPTPTTDDAAIHRDAALDGMSADVRSRIESRDSRPYDYDAVSRLDGVTHDIVAHNDGETDTGHSHADSAVSHDGRAETDVYTDLGPDIPTSPTAIVSVSSRAGHTCVLTYGGTVRCWGRNESGQLGYDRFNDIGDDETPASVGDVQLGEKVVEIATGGSHTCARTESNGVRCWGNNDDGQLGYGNTTRIGDGIHISIAHAPDVQIGAPVTKLALGDAHTCALTTAGNVRCWGKNTQGQLGYGHTRTIGDDERPESAGDVPVGGKVTYLTAGDDMTCAVLDTGGLRCWGGSAFYALGYGKQKMTVGDDETPAAVGDVPIGSRVQRVATAGTHTCVILVDGTVRCWGHNDAGELGYGNTHLLGDDETPEQIGNVDVGGIAVALALGSNHTCVQLDSRMLRCFGWGAIGALGYGNKNDIGDDERPSQAGDVPVGLPTLLPSRTPVSQASLTAGSQHTCAIVQGGGLRCWGGNVGFYNGQLGYGNSHRIGDDETPAQAGNVPVF